MSPPPKDRPKLAGLLCCNDLRCHDSARYTNHMSETKNFETEAQAAKYYSSLTVSAIKAEAAARNWVLRPGNKASLARQLAYWTVGRAADSKAIAGF